MEVWDRQWFCSLCDCGTGVPVGPDPTEWPVTA